MTAALLAAALIFAQGRAGAYAQSFNGAVAPVGEVQPPGSKESANPDTALEAPTVSSKVRADRSPVADQTDIVVTGRKGRPDDPFAGVNAKTFEATQTIDRAFVGPVALAYKRVLPSPVRSGLRNFLYNLREPDVFVNYLLQAKPGKAVETLGRFALNSTIGVGGMVDVAKRRPFKLPRRSNGFANTFGIYGIRNGPFFYLPLIGPTTLRDLAGGLLDRLVLPIAVGSPFNRLAFSVPVGVLSTLDHRAEFDDQLHALHDGVVDPYATSRDFYLRRRQQEIDHIRGRPQQDVPVRPSDSALSAESPPHSPAQPLLPLSGRDEPSPRVKDGA